MTALPHPVRILPLRRGLALVAAVALLAALAGCNLAAGIGYALTGPPGTPAVATLDPTRSTVVFVDDRRSQLPKRALRAEIGVTAEQALFAEEVMPPEQVISSRDAIRAASLDSAEEPLSIVEIGRLVGADVVVYVDVRGFSLTRSGDPVNIAPSALADVKIIDAANNQRLWPPDGDHPVTIQLPRQTGIVQGLSLAERTMVEQQLARALGLGVARLFFETEYNADFDG